MTAASGARSLAAPFHGWPRWSRRRPSSRPARHRPSPRPTYAGRLEQLSVDHRQPLDDSDVVTRVKATATPKPKPAPTPPQRRGSPSYRLPGPGRPCASRPPRRRRRRRQRDRRADPGLGVEPRWSATRGPSGCPVGRTSLRLVQVNYWGFDGIRHRGSLVVASAISSRTASAFTHALCPAVPDPGHAADGQHLGAQPQGTGRRRLRRDAGRQHLGLQLPLRRRRGVHARSGPTTPTAGRSTSTTSRTRTSPPNGTVYPSSVLPAPAQRPGHVHVLVDSAVRAFTRQGFSWGGRWSDPDFQHMELK